MVDKISRGHLIRRLRLARQWFGRRPRKTSAQLRLSGIELRVGADQFASIRTHVEDVRHGEEAGVLLCGYDRVQDRDVLLAREWVPIPDEDKVRRGRYGLEWTASFSARILARADKLKAGVILIHSHGRSAEPGPSRDDRDTAERILSGFSRVLGVPCGSVVLGESAAFGMFFRGGLPCGEMSALRIVGAPIDLWHPRVSRAVTRARRRLDRQNLAIGPMADARLAAASVAVIGVSGGGSHVCQQLAHQGIGRIVPIDDDAVEDVNLGRMVGATPTDVDKSHKTAVMGRLIHSIDPDIKVEEICASFPNAETLEAVKSVDVVVSCVDSFLVREQINAFCRRHLIPLVDVGMNIKTKGEQLERAQGQMIVVLPDSACIRCTSLLSDAVLEREREERPPGYDVNPDAPGDPQVISMNGVLASEACNSVLDLVTGYASGSRGAAWWDYDGRRGEMTRYDLPSRRPRCPACAEQGHGDPASKTSLV